MNDEKCYDTIGVSILLEGKEGLRTRYVTRRTKHLLSLVVDKVQTPGHSWPSHVLYMAQQVYFLGPDSALNNNVWYHAVNLFDAVIKFMESQGVVFPKSMDVVRYWRKPQGRKKLDVLSRIMPSNTPYYIHITRSDVVHISGDMVGREQLAQQVLALTSMKLSAK